MGVFHFLWLLFLLCVCMCCFQPPPPLFEPEWTLRFSLLSYFFVFCSQLQNFRIFFWILDSRFSLLLHSHTLSLPILLHQLPPSSTRFIQPENLLFLKKNDLLALFTPFNFFSYSLPLLLPFSPFPLRNSPLPTLPFPSPSYLSFTSAPLTSFT